MGRRPFYCSADTRKIKIKGGDGGREGKGGGAVSQKKDLYLHLLHVGSNETTFKFKKKSSA